MSKELTGKKPVALVEKDTAPFTSVPIQVGAKPGIVNPPATAVVNDTGAAVLTDLICPLSNSNANAEIVDAATDALTAAPVPLVVTNKAGDVFAALLISNFPALPADPAFKE